jgi:hypothetical protein
LCIKNALKLTYDHLYFKKKKKLLGSLSLVVKGTNNQGRKGRGRGEEGRGERGKGREGERRGGE